ncbi:lysosome membrane protein 2-like [Mytilus galloprovincialis]|uniref:lysosome membrane protein 2-like n=1 Tax=Mytilus galloprovincialis TaxID=29158 RepID=UPI003F7B5060
MKMCSSKSIKCSIIFAVFGAVFIILGGVLIPVFHNYIKKEIKEQIPLKEGSASFKAWSAPPVPIYFQIWVFDLLNPLEVVQNGAKPALRQKGPYTFREHRQKGNFTWNDKDGTISYREKRSFNFEREKSAGPQTDTFTTVNLPMITVVELIRREFGFIQELVEFVLTLAKDDELFLTLSIKDILWGYEDNLLKKVLDFAKKIGHPLDLDDHFGLFYNQNGSDDGLYSIYSGVKSADNFAFIKSWNNMSILPYWTTETCNVINGSDGTLFPPFVQKDDRKYLFSTDICRSIYATFDSEQTIRDIDLLRFTVPPKVFLDHNHNPANEGFCTPHGVCLPSGLLNVSSCKQGAPVVMSLPHFLYADPVVQDAVYGLNPNKIEHQTILDIEPNTGVVMNAQKKLQVNAYIRNVSHITQTLKIKDHIVYPVLWLNESAEIDAKSASDFKSAVQTPVHITQAVQYGLIVLGVLFIIGAAFWFVKVKTSQTKEDDLVTVVDDNRDTAHLVVQ